ncbi:MAG: CO dehydrogenase/acetyl-CoA synthase complex subunit epsilon [Candidatus Nezhaarchaeota archaeon]|nr:CO dehydrogenase/acetyl-CoA synthase complex subunit epsilon [Candidatus Nezhaarchaeota archaeon]MCX8142336.1 CO dehydrogenase/acetyl-CoA synthase complex subunit epsilon [Candidatus Nezhaarchaeota archaeon]MDW8050691.1 CO dehydrogenase/acetyl-CoA synthase complex subunit epsilon [Nitrososphaerota archaeon]
MAMVVKPWQWGNVPGHEMATPVKGDVVAKLIKASKRPLVVVGGAALKEKWGDKLLIDFVAELAKAGMPVIATAHVYKALRDRGVEPAAIMSLADITNRLQDPAWSIDGKGPHDLIIYVGILYQFQSQMLSTLKSFTNLRTLSLDRYFQPNATFSMPNLRQEEWEQALNNVLTVLKP